jgi:signal transduction histidine kinase
VSADITIRPLHSKQVSAVLGRRPRITILALTLGILVIGGVLRASVLWSWREQMVSGAEARAVNLSIILSEYLREAFAAGDASLRQLAVHSRRMGGPDAPPDQWAPVLAAARAGLTGIGSISIVDRNGTIRHSTQPLIVGGARKDQYVFRQLSTLSRDELVVDTPFRTVTTPPQYVLPLGRRLVSEGGRFDGAVVATFVPAEPRRFFRTIDVGQEGVIWVFHPDGVVLFREPSETNPIGERAWGHPIFEAARRQPANATLRGSIQPAGPVFLSGFHVTATPPLIVAVSLSRSEILAEWRRQVVGSAFFFGTLGVVLMGTLYTLFRQMDAKARSEHALAEALRLESIKLQDANDRLTSALGSEQRSRREAEAASRLKEEFLMTVSHELRAPLTSIYGWARMLAIGGLEKGEAAKALESIERNARTQKRLIDDLLDVSRAISGKFRLDVRALNMPEILNAAVDAVRPAAAAKEIRIRTCFELESGPRLGDPERIQQIVWNLLSNAIKFTPRGGDVELRLERAGTHAEIVVTDTGVGISPEFLPYVFERFRQEEAGSERRFGGLGLGLAIVRHLVELHGGSVSAESAGIGRGATFRVRLPVTHPVPAPLPRGP